MVTTVNLNNLHATVHLIYADWDYVSGGYESIFSIPARVVDFSNGKVTVEEHGEDPRRFTFYLHQSPNGMKEWSVKADELHGADDIRLSLVMEED
jgi:hypothetical protein